MPRCVLQATPRGQRKLSNKGPLFFVRYLTNVLEQVESSSQCLAGHYFPRNTETACTAPLGAPGPQKSQGAPEVPLGPDHAEGLGFPLGDSPKFQFSKGFTFITPQHEQGGRCLRDIKSNTYSQPSSFWRFKKIPIPSSFLKPNQGEVRLLLPLAATQNVVLSLTSGA